jgi:hypothetical protein
VGSLQSGDEQSGRTVEDVERFRPTSGRFAGIVLVVAAAAVGLLAVVQPDHVLPEVGAAAVFLGIVAWAVTLRPRISLVHDRLEIRGAVDTVRIPLAGIEELAVRQVLAVRAGDKRYVSTALGRTRRQLMKVKAGALNMTDSDPDTDPNSKVAAPSYPAFVEQRIRQRVDDAREAGGLRRGSPEQIALGQQVDRSYAWPEIVGLVASAALFVVVLVL